VSRRDYNVSVSFELRPIISDEIPEFVGVCVAGFGESVDPARMGLDWTTAELDRSVAAVVDGQIAGTGRLYSFEVVVPGLEVVPAAAVSWIAVLPTHRRQGILTGIMGRHLDDAVDRGEALAILHASEGTIYRRYGYGTASFVLSGRVDRPHSAFLLPVDDPGRNRLVDDAAARKALPDIFDRAWRRRPGAVSRPDYWWEDHVFYLDKRKQEGTGFFVVHEDAGGVPDGYAVYRSKPAWEEGVSRNRLEVEDLVTVTDTARASLWRYLFDVDLVQTIEIHDAPVDEPLRWLLAESRRFHVNRYADSLWVRLLDVPAALSARRYAVEGRLVFEIRDARRPDGEAAGRFALDGGPDGAACTRTDDEPDLSLDVADLGAIYLGGVAPSTLAAAGLIDEHAPGVLTRADTMFVTHPVPFTMTDF